MPLISFKCSVCGETFLSFQRFNLGMGKGPSCPQCESEDTETVNAETPLDGTACEFAAGTGSGSTK